MMQKPKSRPTAKLKYLLILPLMLAMLTYVACSQEQDANQTESLNGVKTIEVESIKSIDNKREAEIVQEIQNIGKGHEKVVIVLEENGMSLVFTKADWPDGFIDRNKEGLQVFSDKMIIRKFKGSTKKKPFTVVSPNGAYFDFTTEKLVLAPPPPPGPPSPPPPPGPPSPFGSGEIPFAAVDKTPVFPGCEGLSNKGAKNCFSSKIAGFIDDNFNKSLAKELGLKGSLRIRVLFKINQNGEVVGVKARAQHPELEKEAVRVVSSLPQMVPGEQNGKKVSVLYSLPIIFKVQ